MKFAKRKTTSDIRPLLSVTLTKKVARRWEVDESEILPILAVGHHLPSTGNSNAQGAVVCIITKLAGSTLLKLNAEQDCRKVEELQLDEKTLQFKNDADMIKRRPVNLEEFAETLTAAGADDAPTAGAQTTSASQPNNNTVPSERALEMQSAYANCETCLRARHLDPASVPHQSRQDQARLSIGLTITPRTERQPRCNLILFRKSLLRLVQLNYHKTIMLRQGAPASVPSMYNSIHLHLRLHRILYLCLQLLAQVQQGQVHCLP